MGRTRCNDDAVEPELEDVVGDQLLPGARAHEPVFARDDYALVLEGLARPAGDLDHVDDAGDVAAAVADVDADPDFAFRGYSGGRYALDRPVFRGAERRVTVAAHCLASPAGASPAGASLTGAS